ncbi:MAG: LytTR family DNA-binding domain-containing protein [Saprospiraceae bacterium]
MIRAIIIDDEKNALEVMKMLINNYCNDVKILEVCQGGQSGIDAINKHLPDLVFLDIEMPMVNGFDVLNETRHLNFKVIFTTAYDQFAIKAFKYSAVDYLLKPIDIEELKTAVTKSLRLQNYNLNDLFQKMNHFFNQSDQTQNKIGLPLNGGYEMVKYNDIVRCESDSNYTTFFLNDKRKIMVSKTLKEIEETITDPLFFRIHNSHLVNMAYIAKVYKTEGGYIIMNDGAKINIARSKKDVFFKLLNKV